VPDRRARDAGGPGEGLKHAKLMFVGEQPGDQEDLQGKPFVGPAGQLFNRALVELGIERRDAYVTNAVKHFKFELRGKRRIHKTPAQQEAAACLHWLESEIAWSSRPPCGRSARRRRGQLMGGIRRRHPASAASAAPRRRPPGADHAASLGAAADGARGTRRRPGPPGCRPCARAAALLSGSGGL
jgi:hypothetical protein